MTGTLTDFRMILDFLSINQTEVAAGNNSTSGACISGIAGLESYFPFSMIVNNQQFNGDKTLDIRTPAVPVPTPAQGENLQYAFFEFQFSWNCASAPATAVITILSPRVAKLTGPAL
jgi:hypothetical protein